MGVALNAMCQTKVKTMKDETESTKLRHSKSMDLIYWGSSVLFGLLACFYHSVGSPVYLVCLIFAGVSAYQLVRIYWYRTQTSHALILTDEYIQTTCALVSKYTYPIAWQDIEAIIWTRDKNKAYTTFLLILLNDRTKILGQVTVSGIKKARKRSKKLFVSGAFDDEDFKSDEAIELNYHYLLNSVIFDLSYIALEDGLSLEKMKQFSGGKLYGTFDFEIELEANDLTREEAEQMMNEICST